MADRRKLETKQARATVEAVQALGVPCIRVQCGRVKVKGGWMWLAPNGTPDFWTPLGWLEQKTDDGELSEDQVKWRAEAERWGTRVATIRDPATAVAIVLAWKQERQHELAMGWR